MKKYILTMGGKEFGWSRHNEVGVFRDFDAEANRLIESIKAWEDIEAVKLDNDYILNWEGYEENKEALQRVGFGFAFKAIGFHEILKTMEEGDCALFVDSNHVVAQDPSFFFNWAFINKVMAMDHIWTEYPCRDWTKRDTFVYMGCDEERYWNAPQMQCSIMGVCKSDFGVSFFEEYLRYCLNSKIMFGAKENPDFPSFNENRHNQSIFSIMVEKYKINYIRRTPNVFLESVIPEVEWIKRTDNADNEYRKSKDLEDMK